MSEFCGQVIPYCGAAKERERRPNDFVRSVGIQRFVFPEEER